MIKRRAMSIDIMTAVKAIRQADGYSQDVNPAKVFPWRVNTIPGEAGQEIISVDETGNAYEDNATIQRLTFEIKISVAKAAYNYTWVADRTEDIWKCLYSIQSAMQTKYGYFVLIPTKDEIMVDENGELEIAESVLTFDVIHEVSEKWEHNSTSY